MSTLADRIKSLLAGGRVLTDREITDELMGRGAPQQHVNQVCRGMEGQGILVRQTRPDGKIGNYLASVIGSSAPQATSRSEADTPHSMPPPSIAGPASAHTTDYLAEDSIKKVLESWLVKQGWQVRVAWGKEPGADIEAWKKGKYWIIEVKGRGSLDAMRVNYFLGILGETLQRMDNPDADYSIALPDLQQFRNLWQRLPDLAKRRTKISILFVDQMGHVFHDDRLSKETP